MVVVAPVIVVLLTNLLIVFGSAFETARLGRRRTKFDHQKGPVWSAPQQQQPTNASSDSKNIQSTETTTKTAVDAVSLAATVLSATAAHNQKAMQSTTLPESTTPEPKRMCQWHGWISLVVLLGLTWVIGIISFTLNSTLGNQLFVVTNGLQVGNPFQTCNKKNY